MYPSVAAAFVPSISGEEGVVHWPYLDNKGLVTAGIGLLVDNGSGHAPPVMLALPWKIEAPGLAARTATNAEIEAAWQKVKAQQAWASHGGGQQEWADLTDIRLDDAGILNATTQWLQQNEPTLRKFFPGYDKLPADAQLGLLGMSYAMGSAFAPGYPSFTRAVNAVVPDFVTASNQSAINKNVTDAIAAHNETNKQLFLNAAAAQHSQTPYSQLWWPQNTDPGAAVGVAMRGAGIKVTPAGLLTRVLIGSGLVTAGMFGLASYSAVKAGRPWTSPATDFAKEARAFGRGVDARVRGLLPGHPTKGVAK